MKLSIIIVSYNVRSLLVECISSLYKHIKGFAYEIIVVDNNSSDGSLKTIADQFPEVICIQNVYNAGFSAGNNQGINISTGAYIFLLNPDTYLIDDSISEMLHYLENRNDLVLLSPRLLNANKSIQVSAWKDKNLPVIALELFRIFPDRYPLTSYIQDTVVHNVAGASMMFRRDLLQKIGRFDETFFWMEDFDFCYRVRLQGGHVIYFPKTILVHVGGQSTASNLKLAYANANTSKLKFYKKHYSPFHTAVATVIIFLHILSRLVLYLLLSPFQNKFRRLFFAYLYTVKKYFGYVFLKDGSLI
jgi:GT2 family glycosyltransferase